MITLHSQQYRHARQFRTACLLVLLAACQSPPPAGPEGEIASLSADESRLVLNVRDLPTPPRFTRFRAADGRYEEETAEWGDAPDQVRAGLRLSVASPGPPLTDPPDSTAIVESWAALRDRRPAFGEPGSAQNSLGPATWWRAQLGTSVCVVFVQRPAAETPAVATLSGFYCNPQGLPLSAPAAVTVVENVGLRQPPQGQ